MSIPDFDRCTPDEFRAIYDAWAKINDSENRVGWERARLLCLCLLLPYASKQLTPRDVMEFPWEITDTSEPVSISSTNDTEEINQRYLEAKKRYGLS